MKLDVFFGIASLWLAIIIAMQSGQDQAQPNHQKLTLDQKLNQLANTYNLQEKVEDAVLFSDGKFDDHAALLLASFYYHGTVHVVIENNKNGEKAVRSIAQFLYESGAPNNVKFYIGANTLGSEPEVTHEAHYPQADEGAMNHFGLSLGDGDRKLQSHGDFNKLVKNLKEKQEKREINVHQIAPTPDNHIDEITTIEGVHVALYQVVHGFNSRIAAPDVPLPDGISIEKYWADRSDRFEGKGISFIVTNSFISWSGSSPGNDLSVDILRKNLEPKWVDFVLEANTYTARLLAGLECTLAPLRDYYPDTLVPLLPPGLDGTELIKELHAIGRDKNTGSHEKGEGKNKYFEMDKWAVKHLSKYWVRMTTENDVHNHLQTYFDGVERILALAQEERETGVETQDENRAKTIKGILDYCQTHYMKSFIIHATKSLRNKQIVAELTDFNHLLSLLYQIKTYQEESDQQGRMNFLRETHREAYWIEGSGLSAPTLRDLNGLEELRKKTDAGGLKLDHPLLGGLIAGGFKGEDTYSLAKHFFEQVRSRQLEDSLTHQPAKNRPKSSSWSEMDPRRKMQEHQAWIHKLVPHGGR